jgi:hypothetical protein
MRTIQEREECRNKVVENIINVIYNKPLTMPLRELNKNCKFNFTLFYFTILKLKKLSFVIIIVVYFLKFKYDFKKK